MNDAGSVNGRKGNGALAAISAEGELLRRLAYAGARYGPRFWLKYSPPFFGVALGTALPKARAQVLYNLRLVHGERGGLSEGLDVARTFSDYAHCLAESLAMERPEAGRARRRLIGDE